MKSALFLAAILGTTRVIAAFYVTPAAPTYFDVFKDIAHLYMGGLFVAAWRESELPIVFEDRNWYWPIFWSMCILEVAVAVCSRIL